MDVASWAVASSCEVVTTLCHTSSKTGASRPREFSLQPKVTRCIGPGRHDVTSAAALQPPQNLKLRASGKHMRGTGHLSARLSSCVSSALCSQLREWVCIRSHLPNCLFTDTMPQNKPSSPSQGRGARSDPSPNRRPPVAQACLRTPRRWPSTANWENLASASLSPLCVAPALPSVAALTICSLEE